ncbi:MAG TPA: S8 family serine peptidase, partial [Chitinophagaceae bacterium]|nr:S8 family serine peptidase [Chitinophagaceae bacterium]
MIRTFTIFVFSLLATISVTAQKLPDRVSPVLQSKAPGYYLDSVSTYTYLVEMDHDRGFSFPGINSKHAGWGIFIIRTSPAKLWKFIASDIPYRYIDEQLKPQTEGGVLNYDMSANRITTAWHEFPGIRGEGQIVSVKENRMDTNDIDLLKRHVPSGNISPVGETHATIMTTLIAGAGNSYYTGNGVAPKTKYSSSDFITVLPDTITYYTGLDIRVQNHSYGTGIQNFYGINARAFDLSANAVPELLHLFSSGNSGNQASGQGIYAGIAGFANITGNMKMAKNVMLTGAMDSTGIVPLLSSKGPLYDGRLAPHVVAFGEDGTSGAAALSSGLAVLLQQMHASTMSNVYASSSLVRAIIANSADDIYTPGPDYSSGFGKMNAASALLTVKDKRFFTGELTPLAEKDFTVDVPAGATELR